MVKQHKKANEIENKIDSLSEKNGDESQLLLDDCDDNNQHSNVNSDVSFKANSVDSKQYQSTIDEPTEELLDEVMIKTKKRKKLFIALGAIVGVFILAALAFLIPAQMKASEINKSLDLGEKYLEEGKYEEAILAFDDVIAIEPKQVTAYEGKGSANIGLKNYTEAEAQLETAKTIDYTDNGKVLMSDVYINTNRKDLGTALLDEVTNHNPEETRVIVYVSQLYSQLNEFNKVIELLEKKITSTTDKEDLKKFYNELINTYVKAGKTEAEIITLLERAAKATDDQSYLNKKDSYCVKKPSFSLAPGEYQGTQSLEIIKGNTIDKVYYTIDGSEPGITSTEYTTPISLQPGSITVKVIEVNENGVKCPVQEGNYSIKKNKLTNEEFINKVSGVWYFEKYKLVLKMTNTRYSVDAWLKDGCYGDYVVSETTENGGTINITNLIGEGMNAGQMFINFDFGTPNDNKISVLGNNNGTWQEYVAAEFLGNDQYRVPFPLGGNPSTIVKLQN